MEVETGSKKIGYGDHESESGTAIAAIDLLPPEMLQSIFEYLPFPDLLRCREVNKKWKSMVADPVRKRCAPIDFTRPDIPKSQRSRALRSFSQFIRATIQQGEFPVTEFQLNLNSDYYWIQMDGSTLISQFLEAVGPFVKHIIFNLSEKSHEVSNDSLAIPQYITFPNLMEMTLKIEYQNIENGMLSFIRNVIEKSPNIKELYPQFYNIRNGAIRRCIVETGIEQRASFVTSLIINTPENELDLEYLKKLGFKLKHLSLNLVGYYVNAKIFGLFLESQSGTLTSLTLSYGNSSYFRELPCLPHLKDLSISLFTPYKNEQVPTLFYKEMLPALKKMDLADARFAPNYFMANHPPPCESLRELILPQRGIADAGEVIRQAARLFPNLKKLQVFHESVGPYLNDIYEELAGIEELCIVTYGYMNVDDIITGLPEKLLRKIADELPPSYNLSKALAMLERGTTKTLVSLEDLKILVIDRRGLDSRNVVVGRPDFTDLSGIVLKQMKGLQRIDFGIRDYGPNVSTALKEDLEAHGIKLLYRKSRYIRSRTDFIVSLTESDESDSVSYVSDSGSYISDSD